MGRFLMVGVLAVVLMACTSTDLAENVGEGGADGEVEADPDDAPSSGSESEEGGIRSGASAPDWLPPGIRLPDGIDIMSTSNDQAANESRLLGIIEGGDPATVGGELASSMESNGFELLSAEGAPGRYVLAREGVGVVTIEVEQVREISGVSESGAVLQLTVDRDADIEMERMANARLVTSRGTVTAVVDGTSHELEGECQIQGHSRLFNSDDGSIFLHIDTASSPAFVSATVSSLVDDSQFLFTMDSNVPATGDITSNATPEGFSVSGVMQNMLEPSQVVNATIQVDCGN